MLRAQNKSTQEIVAIKKFKRKFYTWEECMALREVRRRVDRFIFARKSILFSALRMYIENLIE